MLVELLFGNFTIYWLRRDEIEVFGCDGGEYTFKKEKKKRNAPNMRII